ncbi:hypothetical protein A4U64_11190 [Rhodococcus sp. WB1]|nr:hypothetical protein A4U64_11190 [Rhodococcus sp. WB1]PND52355.1 hypothetical protein CQZ88_09160 [Rhodococcus sp. ENV425]
MPMSNDRLVDDSVFSRSTDSRPAPQFTTSLITQLGLARASAEEKEQGIARWLSGHHPSERLRKSLIRSGYRHLLHLNA